MYHRRGSYGNVVNNRYIRDNAPQQANNSRQYEYNSPDMSVDDDRFDKLERRFEQVFDKLVALEKGTGNRFKDGHIGGNSDGPFNRYTSSPNTIPNRGIKECYYCKKRGHIKAHCFAFQRDQLKLDQSGPSNDKGQTLLLGSIVKDNRVGKGVI